MNRPPVRCSIWARAEAVDPVGTAGSYAGFCCVTWPPPWPPQLTAIPALAGLVQRAEAAGFRVQLLVDGQSSEKPRVIVYRAAPTVGFSGYTRADYDLSADLQFEVRPEPPRSANREPLAGRDLLVCVHGRRDVCCGSAGMRLVQELERSTGLSGARVWRTSHTGGHRFAPTAILLPEGTLWAFLDPAVVNRIIHRDGPIDVVLPHYRGCTGLGSPALQFLERAVLASVGWDLFDCQRSGREYADGRVELTVTAPTGGTSLWRGRVATRSHVPIPECGQPLVMADRFEPQLELLELERLTERAPQ